MSLTEFLHRVIRILDEAGVPYMLTGSLASAFYAIPRATQVGLPRFSGQVSNAVDSV